MSQRGDDPEQPRPGYDIYIKEKAVLERAHRAAYIAIGKADELEDDGKEGKKKRKGSEESVKAARRWICENFFDVRTFGAVMALGINCGQVRGPVQMTFARSIDPIIATEHSITRMAVATEKESDSQDGDNRTMGRKHTVPYGLYMAHGFVSAFLADQTTFGADDLDLLWQSLEHMFEHDRSAARGEMSTRGLYVFEHDNKLGNAHAHALFDLVRVNKTAEVPRSFADYAVSVDASSVPAGVNLIRRLG
jgi:CRISPR-associated protein Csd2